MSGPTSKRVRRQLESLLQVWPEDPERFRCRSALICRWASVCAGAERHGVLGILHQAWIQSSFALPVEQKSALARQMAVHKLLNLDMLPALQEALAALDAAGIPCVALKGPVLGERLFGNAFLRPALDLDILIAPDRLDRAVQALKAIGYQADSGPTAEFFRRHHHHLHLYRPGRPTLELHFQPSSNFGAELSAADLLTRSRAHRLHSGMTCRILAPEDELLYLAVHAAGHRFARLGWLYDIKTFLRQHERIDWPVVIQRAQAAGVLGVLGFTIEVLRRQLRVEPMALVQQARRSSVRFVMSGWLVSALETLAENAGATRLLGLAYESLLCDRPASVLRLVRKRLAVPRG